jgi:hypothetical protein
VLVLVLVRVRMRARPRVRALALRARSRQQVPAAEQARGRFARRPKRETASPNQTHTNASNLRCSCWKESISIAATDAYKATRHVAPLGTHGGAM